VEYFDRSSYNIVYKNICNTRPEEYTMTKLEDVSANRLRELLADAESTKAAK
jgi:hypothetical protein